MSSPAMTQVSADVWDATGRAQPPSTPGARPPCAGCASERQAAVGDVPAPHTGTPTRAVRGGLFARGPFTPRLLARSPLARTLSRVRARACLLLCGALLIGGLALVTLGRPAASGAAPDSAAWRDALQTLANLRAEPPQDPLVVLFGGSAFRECTVDDTSWSAQISEVWGSPVQARNLASSMQTFGDDLTLMPYLPRDRTIVLIGVNVVRFSQPTIRPPIALPEPVPEHVPSFEHRYDQQPRLSDRVKRAMVRDWMRHGYPRFQRRYATSAGQLRALIERCQYRGLYPVLLEAPWNGSVIRHSWDPARRAYMAWCRTLAKRYEVPYLGLTRAARLTNARFHDVYHLRAAGRRSWQRELSVRCAALLTRYCPTPDPPDPTPSPDPTTSRGSSRVAALGRPAL